MRKDASTLVDRPRAGMGRVDPAPSPGVTRPLYRIDVLCAAIGLTGLVEYFRARAGFSNGPISGLILPALCFLIWPAYRLRALGWSRELWGRVEAFSDGSGRIPWMAAAVFVTAPSWLLYLSNQVALPSGDTAPVIPTAISILKEGNAELGEFFGAGGKIDFLRREGRVPRCFQARPNGIYSAYPSGMVPFSVAVAGLSTLSDANLDSPAAHLHLEKMTASMVAALSVGLFFLIGLRLAPPAVAWVVSAILAAGSGLFSTVGMTLWQHGGVIFWSLTILLIEFRRVGRASRWDSAFQGFACAMLVTCRLSSISFLVPLGLWVLAREPRRAASIVAVSGLAYLPWAWANQATYGNPFGPSTGFLAGKLWSLRPWEPLSGVLFSPARGLLIYQPWLILALASAIPSVRSRVASLGSPLDPPGWASFCGSAIVLHLLLISAWGCWWGGWCWGSRLVVEIVPIGALLCLRPVTALWASRRGRALVVALGLLGVLVQIPAVYFDAGRWNATADVPDDLWSWSRAPFLDWYRGR
jgi:hypothetical protein